MIEVTLLAAFLCGLALVAICHPRRELTLAALIGVTAGFSDLQVGGVHLFTVLVGLWALFVFGRRPARVVGWTLALAGTAVMVASTSLVGDLVVSPTLALQLLGMTFCATAIGLWSTARERRTMFYGLLTATTVSAVYALLQVTGIAATSVVHLEISAIGRPSGLTPEPDWLGMFSAIGMILAFVLPMRRDVRTVVLGLNTAAWLLAFARAAWLALAVVVVAAAVLAVVDRRRTRAPAVDGRGRTRAVVVAVVAVVAVVLVQPVLRADLTTRVMQLLGAGVGPDSSDRSGQARVEQVTALLDLSRSGPFYGHGLSSAGRVGVSGKLYLGDYSSNSVASNWVLGLWVDARYVALPFIAVLVLVTVVTLRSLGGAVAAVVLVSSLFSNATYFPVFWLALGCAVATLATRVVPKPKSKPARTPTRNRPGDASSAPPVGRHRRSLLPGAPRS
ncbi:hypothetical protein HQ602_14275 [Rhodococcus kroppenstedtii]|uniref:hypothetical protein n=1 Tax=Rhodococcoides kroppenstedtii TaxID=293050 RepID=UPI001C9B42BE|nr:hypothetical protein [Rhodococcus kroppenstedtii]MBY6437550.1 hypothetical protein [Rhodococcus kroppenstedtii]